MVALDFGVLESISQLSFALLAGGGRIILDVKSATLKPLPLI